MSADLDAACRCGGRRHHHAGRTGGGRCLGHGWDVVTESAPCPDVCQRFRQDPVDRARRAALESPSEALRAYGRRRDRRRSAAKELAGPGFSVGPSDHGSCHKAIEYRERPPEGYEPLYIPKDAADVGSMLHEELTRARRGRYPWRRFKVRVDVPGLDRPGEADEVDDLIGRVTDFKSAGDWAWERLGKEGPPDHAWKQVLTYGLGLEHAGVAVADLELVYVNREKGTAERFVRPYSRAAAQAAVAELHAVVDALEQGRPLPRVRAGDELLGPTVNALCARHCPAVRHCWGLDEVPDDRTPEGWLYARDDADGAIEGALVAYDESRAREGEGKKRKEYAKVLLVGVEPGRYGDMLLGWSGGNLSEPKPDHEARRKQVEDEMRAANRDGRVPPAPEDLPYPTARTRSPVSIRVGPVRRARVEDEQAAAVAS